ncbi:uncharacterized protein PHACADRAFT_249454 [Phanerochaete carnosa HHB-10118-sp]|uniref:Uncharacterized protein n=1 Tax=Phanerochaete carnosa (strain HHB-10118-sp) TaxID=650164 RepID=K5WJ83_PHACS|nr:uncharacterized protein PHACADRAFT_249454 [Phanerochaete carnosa HHB-10118-sp]EKM59184.1 hypothetical protein PHACADRAFT_249454 [Phanerochaete carnosa HHB-10118-sp]
MAYEFIMNLDREIVAVWCRKWTTISSILVILRWTLVLQMLFSWLSGPTVRDFPILANFPHQPIILGVSTFDIPRPVI